MSTEREELIDWLRDAYAMECGLETTLEKESANDELPESIREKARIHLDETRRHAKAVKSCLEQLGADTSALKTGFAKFMETAKGFSTNFARDDRIKDFLAAYASEHFEIASYLALRAAAEEAGEPQIVAVCDQIIPDEERMAAWIKESLPNLVRTYLKEVAVA